MQWNIIKLYKIMKFDTHHTCIFLENIIVKEISQTKDKYYMTPLT